jgi:hypothetical protein
MVASNHRIVNILLDAGADIEVVNKVTCYNLLHRILMRICNNVHLNYDDTSY